MRHRERQVIECPIVDQQIEARLGDFGAVTEPGQPAIDLRDREPWPLFLIQQREQRQRHIGVAGEAVAFFTAVFAQRDGLQQQVHAAYQHVARDVRVVRADVVLLRDRVVQLARGAQVELDDADIRWEPSGGQVVEIFKPRIATPDTLADRFQETLFEFGGAGRRVQRQRGDDVERDRRVVLRAPV